MKTVFGQLDKVIGSFDEDNLIICINKCPLIDAEVVIQ